MTPAERAWTEARIVEWSERAASNRRIAATRTGPINRAIGLDSVVRRLQARLDAAGPPLVVDVTDPVDVSPVSFAAAGVRVDAAAPVAAEARERHLQSAAVCRKLGDEAAARAFEALAEGRVAVPSRPTRSADKRKPAIAAPIMPQPPAHDPVPFTAGPQMEMFR